MSATTVAPTFVEIETARRRWQAAGHSVTRAAIDIHEVNPDDPDGEPVWRIDDAKLFLSTRDLLAQAPDGQQRPTPPAIRMRPAAPKPTNGAGRTLADIFGTESPAPAVAPDADIKQLSLSQIRRDGGTQPRAALDDETISDYAEAMQAGAQFPPVVVFYDGASYWLADGFHRVNAAIRAVLPTINAQVIPGTQRDAILYSIGANATHGLRRTNADKRRAVERLLRDDEWAKWSDREIARRCAVSNNFVSEFRRSLSSDDSERTYTTKHGTVSIMNTTAIGQAVESEHIGRAPAQPLRIVPGTFKNNPSTPVSDLQSPIPDLRPATAGEVAVLEVEDSLLEIQHAQSHHGGSDGVADSSSPVSDLRSPVSDLKFPHTIGPVTILCGDARKAVATVTPPVNLVITSPPYNTGGIVSYDGHHDNLSPDDYDALLFAVWRQCHTVMAPGGRLCINVPFGMGRNPWQPVTPDIYRQLIQSGFDIEGQIIWDKGTTGNSTAWGSWGRPSNPVLRDTCEAIVIARKHGESPMPLDILVQIGPAKHVSPWLREEGLFMQLTQDHWQIAPESAMRIGHPAPFPVKLAEHLTRLYGWPGCHILDPFAGSGTTGVAVLGLPGGDTCRVTLIERSAAYCALAAARLNRITAQPSLLAGRAPDQPEA